jgi:hypothetical protein
LPGQSAAQTKLPFEVTPQLPCCAPMPGGGWPQDWSRNANAAGPIASQRQEWVSGDFISVFHPQVRRWIKKTYFSADCRDILVAAAEFPGATKEVWSPVGLIASYDADLFATAFRRPVGCAKRRWVGANSPAHSPGDFGTRRHLARDCHVSDEPPQAEGLSALFSPRYTSLHGRVTRMHVV